MVEIAVPIIMVVTIFGIVSFGRTSNTREAIIDFLWMLLLFTIIIFTVYMIFGV